MYSRGNNTAPVGQGPYTSTTPFHQHPLAPPPPISQSPHPSLPPMIQQGLHPIPSQVGQLSHHVYPHTPSGLPQQGPPNSVMPTAINDRPYLAPAPPKLPPQSLQVHVISQMPQHSQWTHNAPLIQLTGLSLAPRVLPPPPSLGKTPFSNQVNQPTAASMHAPVQQHPQSSSSHAIPSVRSFEHTMPLSSNTPVKPPQPPTKLSSLPGSPRLPSSSPPPTPSASFSMNHISRAAASESSVHPKVGLEINNSGSREISASGSADFPPEMVSAQGENLTEDLPPPPLKPVDDRTVRIIELLCQFIAKNGPEFENMTRLKEFENPEFKFLFGGEPGTEAVVAHEYFVWAKRKCYLELRSAGNLRNCNSLSRLSEGFSSQQNITSGGGVPSSPTDSDMDMEDDITHPDEEPHSFLSEKQNHETVSVSNGLDKEPELQPLTSIEVPSLANDSVDGTLQHSESLGSMEQRQDGLSLTVNRTSTPHEGLSQPSLSAKPAEIMLQKLPNPPFNLGVSPFRLLQDYASDESSRNEYRHTDMLPTSFDPSVEVGSTSLGKDEGVLESDKGLKRLSKPFKIPSSSSAKSEAVLVGADMTSTTGKSEDFVDNSSANQEPCKDVISPGKHSRDGSVPVGNVVMKKDPKSMSSSLEVDEFGRLIREGDSDSDFDGSPRYNQRRRGRSNSKSRSPHERRSKSRSPEERRRSRSRSRHERRRRSPRRRSEWRGRSHSLSPKRRRSRSRSPPSQHRGDTMRRDKGRRPECFDFVKGKCYRGASCRYMHHEEKRDRSISYRSRQQFQHLPHGSRTSDVQEKFERPDRKLSREINEGRAKELKPLDGLPITEEKKDRKAVMDGTNNGLLEPSINLITDAKMEGALGDVAHGRASAIDKAELQQSQSNFSARLFQNAYYQRRKIDTYPDTESTAMCKPFSIPTALPIDKSNIIGGSGGQPCANSNSMDKPFPSESISSQYMVPKESVPPVADHLSNLPLLFPSVSQDTTSSFNQGIPGDYTLKPPAAKFPSLTAPAENFPPYQAQHSEYVFQPNPSWNSAPPPPAQSCPSHPTFVNDMTLTSGLHSGSAVHFVQNVMPPKNDFYSQSSARPYLTDYPQSNVGQNQGCPSLQEPNRPPDHLDDLQPRTIATSQTMSQSQGVSGLAREDHFAGRPGPGIYTSSSYGKKSFLSQPMSFSGNLRYNFGTSQIVNHFNPYASTFEQPLSSKTNSNILDQEKDKSFKSALGPALSHGPVEGRVVSLGSVLPVEGVLPQPTGDQYDPLYDSIEPYLDSVRKSHYGQKHEMTDESDDMLRFSGSNKPLDGEEKKQKGHGASEVSGSLQNEEYGETADAEVGAVENGSPSNPIDAVDKDEGEVEIDQVKTPGKNKKSKDSRSMKLFKVAIANFVKEVLKPSWRQGIMSKEAFKTIVKKTVDRVSGAMESHQIPKSQAKINYYIDSSERKLTKLVMGYVDKYVKV